MSQLVKHVIEDLKRFNPDARIEEDVEIQGVSPLTSCRIETIGGLLTSGRLSQLEDENTALDERNDELLKAVKEAKELLAEGNPGKAAIVLEEVT